jgi:hypothetical protein
VIDAPPDIVWAAARAYDMQSNPLVQRIFRMRELLTGAGQGKREPQGLIAGMYAIGWGTLREEPGTFFVAGAACPPWLPDVRYRLAVAPSACTIESSNWTPSAQRLDARRGIP